MSNILFLTTMYPGPLRPSTPVCKYFVDEWAKLGHNVIVVHYRSIFPKIYTMMAKAFPRLASMYVGNHVEMDREEDIVEYFDGVVKVYSIPIFKYMPHGKYPKSVICHQMENIESILHKHYFVPDAIIGHFYNPQIEIISNLKKIYPNAKTCVSLHETDTRVIKRVYRNYKELLLGVDIIGFRSNPIKWDFERNIKTNNKSFLCFSGVSDTFLNREKNHCREFTDAPLSKFIFVGQLTPNKCPETVVSALNEFYPNKSFNLTYVGKKNMRYEQLYKYVVKNQLEDNVCFTGQINRESIVDYLDQSECLIVLSKSEVFGLVYLEAMARGCIAIASRGQGMEGIIKHGQNGFLCNAGDKEELKRVISHINNLSAEQKRLISQEGIKTAQELSDKNVAKMYIDMVLGS